MDFLVIGGTRFIGKRMVAMLLELGHEVTIFSRGNALPKFESDVKFIVGDRHDRASFMLAMEGKQFDVVIDNLVFSAEDAQLAVDVFQGNIKHYILTSSVAVYRGTSDATLFQEDQVDFMSREGTSYALGKREAELVFWRLIKQNISFPFTILRPTVVEGPDDYTLRTWYWVQRAIDGKAIVIPKPAENTMLRHVYVDDVARAYTLVANNPVAFNRAYNIAGEEVLSLKEYIADVISCVGSSSQIVSAPQAEFEYPSYYMGPSLLPDINRAKQEIKFLPTARSVWFLDTMKFYSDQKNKLSDSSHYEHRKDEILLAQKYIENCGHV